MKELLQILAKLETPQSTIDAVVDQYHRAILTGTSPIARTVCVYEPRATEPYVPPTGPKWLGKVSHATYVRYLRIFKGFGDLELSWIESPRDSVWTTHISVDNLTFTALAVNRLTGEAAPVTVPDAAVVASLIDFTEVQYPKPVPYHEYFALARKPLSCGTWDSLTILRQHDELRRAVLLYGSRG